ncbi:elongation factor Ts [Vibrio algivorus]|uniref:Translation elongation factor Ts n=1 Tax=Vibrio algivorus TaxID=1667024 RepID=A0ABQ6EMM5_9VIBR|nr:elongation factor Ts [Vibrio algivorus]GLT14249.1 translation elongation factor Ts [Vibrio algivorus]
MEKQNQIKSLLKELSWGVSTLADLVLEERYSDDCGSHIEISPEERTKEVEKIKKHLQRETTPDEKLNLYLRIIRQHPDFEALKLDYVFPQYVEHECLSPEVVDIFKNLKW